MGRKRIVIKNLDYTAILPIVYCANIMSATFVRWTNYTNIFLLGVGIIYIVKQKTLKKSYICWLWAVYVLIYPILDYAIRNGKGDSLYVFLCYSTVIMMLLVGCLKDKDFRLIIKFIKYFAYFQATGIYLSEIAHGLYIKIAWRLVAFWSSKVTGFSPDPTVATQILSMGIGVCFVTCFCENKRDEKIKSGVGLIVLFIALIKAGKRSFLIAILISCVIILIAKNISNRFVLIKTIMFSVVLIMGGVAISLIMYKINGSSNALGRIGETILGAANGEDVSSMRSTWATYMNEWKQGHELFGIGWENFQIKIMDTPYGGKVPNGHCVYRQLLCETGYIGFSVFIILISVTLYLAIKNILLYSRIQDNIPLQYSMISAYIAIVFAIYCYTGNAIYDPYVYLYFFMSVVMIGTMNNFQKSLYWKDV